MDDYEPDHSDADDDFELSLDERLALAPPAAVPNNNTTGNSELQRETAATLRILDAMARIGRGEPVPLDEINALDEDYARIRLKWAPPSVKNKEEKK
jgi:hypothetical protein